MDLDLDEDDEDSESDTLDVDFGDEASSDTSSTDEKDTLYQQTKDLCGGADLMQVFGPSGSAKSTYAFEVVKSGVNQHDLDALVIDTERNVLNLDAINGADYVYIPEWHDLYSYVAGHESELSEDSFGQNTTNSLTMPENYDVVLLDSIGFPALVQYGEYRVADSGDQFKVFNELQVITGKLKQYSQRNNALTIVTNQPKSDLSDETDPAPFGDKSIFGFKEVWKTQKVSSNEVATNCDINAFRSRRRGKGSTIFNVEVSDSGVDVEYKDEDPSDEWT